jgi:Divergent InlB B-repeat domain
MRKLFKHDLSAGLREAPMQPRSFIRALLPSLAALSVLALSSNLAQASTAYGSINNFDTVNDTSNVCHGFEIELDDIQTTDITYTYDYNHYGTPKITQFTTNDFAGWHTNVLVRYEAVWTSTGWSAYTAVPTTNIPPTQGHAFTNPSLNFGGEHFGVGYRNSPTKVYYYWLTDSGSSLVRGPQVYVSTPVFTTPAPVVVGQPVAVMPVIPAPVLPVAPPPPVNPEGIVYEFSDATWVKVIATTSHTNNPVPLRDLLTPDTNNPSAKDWRNGEPDEVETEWQLLQTDFGASGNPPPANGGANGQLANHTNNVASDDVVTYRYEYYAYVGPYADLDTHEALAQSVAADGTNGTGTYSSTVVVGKFLGAQMSAMAATPPIGLIDHLPDAEEGVLYPTRSVVIAGTSTNFTATCSGLPAGMYFDTANGWVWNTPSTSGVFLVTISVSTSNRPVLTKHYPLMVAPTGVVLPPHSSVDTSVSPANGGTASGDGVYTNGTTATVVATASAGFKLVNWTENGVVVGTLASYTFTNIINQSLVANFVPAPTLSVTKQPNALLLAWPTNFSGFTLQQISNLKTNNWGTAAEPVGTVGTNHQATVLTTNGPRFFRLMHP